MKQIFRKKTFGIYVRQLYCAALCPFSSLCVCVCVCDSVHRRGNGTLSGWPAPTPSPGQGDLDPPPDLPPPHLLARSGLA